MGKFTTVYGTMMVRTRRRNSLRLSTYDYSDPGDYFVTICTFRRELWLSKIQAARVVLSARGATVLRCWEALPTHYAHVVVQEFVLMPNHLHGIITLTPRTSDDPRHDLSEIMRWFKDVSTQHINRMRGTIGQRTWQRGFYDRIVWHPRMYTQFRQYILENPLRWELDRLHPHHPNPFPMDDE